MPTQYHASQDIKVTRKYFVGTTVLRKGQIIFYQENASATDADPNLRLGNAVEAVNTDNVGGFAGVVPDGEAGKTGPCFVELLQPQVGDVLQAEIDGTTNVAAGDLLEPDATLGALIKATAGAGDVLFRSFEAYTTDATKSAKWVVKV